LQGLARYSSSSVRWLRNRLSDQSIPLPHYRVNGKILVKREQFDAWMEHFRVVAGGNGLNVLIEDMVQAVVHQKQNAERKGRNGR
jgi:hypothetical protein